MEITLEDANLILEAYLIVYDTAFLSDNDVALIKRILERYPELVDDRVGSMV